MRGIYALVFLFAGSSDESLTDDEAERGADGLDRSEALVEEVTHWRTFI